MKKTCPLEGLRTEIETNASHVNQNGRQELVAFFKQLYLLSFTHLLRIAIEKKLKRHQLLPYTVMQISCKALVFALLNGMFTVELLQGITLTSPLPLQY